MCVSPVFAKGSPASVSYTHLDVYKRQTELYNLKREYDEWKIRLAVCPGNNDVEIMIWYGDERDLNRELYVNKETELYNLNREHDEWKESLEVYLNNNDDNDLTKVINPIRNTITDGDLTNVLNVDWLHDYFGKMRCV